MKQKTTIYLPANKITIWNQEKHRIALAIAGYLNEVHAFKPTRACLMRRRRAVPGGRIVSIYWEIDLLNRLRAFANATRTSVSLLICHLLDKWLRADRRESNFPNYYFSIPEWTSQCRVFLERLDFPPTPRSLSP